VGSKKSEVRGLNPPILILSFPPISFVLFPRIGVLCLKSHVSRLRNVLQRMQQG
jgi:hypothetical protein